MGISGGRYQEYRFRYDTEYFFIDTMVSILFSIPILVTFFMKQGQQIIVLTYNLMSNILNFESPTVTSTVQANKFTSFDLERVTYLHCWARKTNVEKTKGKTTGKYLGSWQRTK